MLRNSISAVSFALLLILVSFTGCMDDSEDDSTNTVEQPDASNDEIYKAADMAMCTDFINKLENKFETKIGENGIKLSGGEKQRLSIARAFLKNSKIILLDEATSSLDSETEEKIQKALEKLISNKTTIVIAHRLSLIHI